MHVEATRSRGLFVQNGEGKGAKVGEPLTQRFQFGKVSSSSLGAPKPGGQETAIHFPPKGADIPENILAV